MTTQRVINWVNEIKSTHNVTTAELGTILSQGHPTITIETPAFISTGTAWDGKTPLGAIVYDHDADDLYGTPEYREEEAQEMALY